MYSFNINFIHRLLGVMRHDSFELGMGTPQAMFPDIRSSPCMKLNGCACARSLASFRARNLCTMRKGIA